jgi:CheY-like chemotaxis protein
VQEECEEDREEKKKKKALILVVDDNMVNQKVIGRFLAKIGLENIITAYDGKQAIDIVLERFALLSSAHAHAHAHAQPTTRHMQC